MASANRASVATRGVPGVALPQDAKSLEHAFAPLFTGTDPRARQLRRAFGRPGGSSSPSPASTSAMIGP